MNDSNDTTDEREELGLFYYYKVYILPVKWHGVIWKWTLINCKCILKTLGQPLKRVKKKSINDNVRKVKKLNDIKCSKPQKAEKEMEDKNEKKEQEQQKENQQIWQIIQLYQ